MSTYARSSSFMSWGRSSLTRLAPLSSSQFAASAPRRFYAVASGATRFQVFNRRTKWLQKERSASNPDESRQADYLKDEVAIRLTERLLDINRHFPIALDLGANSCNVAKALTRENPDPDPNTPESAPLSARIGELIATDSSEARLYRDANQEFNKELSITRQVVNDEETIQFEPESFDLVLSSLSLHWINDLPGVLSQINNVLKPDCPFIGAMLGGDTLFELRTSLQLAEQERRGGMSPHVSPLADVRDVGGLLQKAGFKMLTVDVDDIIVDYPDTFALMQDLQAMGEGNAILNREMGPIRRDVLLANEAIYRALHGNPDGSIPATFRIIYMIGWREGENQPQPLARGSGQTNLKDILEKK
ncbi:methyltransferase type 12 [Trichoderma arundinaceum]|uniref:Methyltransferase type 12 n=1 Tax=Trichoderma arundinaceum TaxID=490622 RepID=A0A395NSN3_TRIAR|nr:methyltransferase type 12 [Trichoderma arundinaceum]